MSPDEAIIEFDVFLIKPGTRVSGWPGRRSMSTQLIGKLDLENGETVWVTVREESLSESMTRDITSWKKGLSRFGGPDIRALIFGIHEEDGSRVYVDLDMAVAG
jgi:hypothetical protein